MGCGDIALTFPARAVALDSEFILPNTLPQGFHSP